jgi:CRP/FNR family cyclic AMP-dependent transcriptional regulator
MTTLSQFKKGDLLFRQGDASDRVVRVRRGEIEVLREVGATSVLLGHVRGGEWLGEMGVIEGRSRSATARAAADGEVEVLTARQFLDRVSSDPALAHDLILRLSIRLRRIEDKIAGELLHFAHDRSPDGAGETASDAVVADDDFARRSERCVARWTLAGMTQRDLATVLAVNERAVRFSSG